MKLYIVPEWVHDKNLAAIKRSTLNIIDTIEQADTVWMPSGETNLNPSYYPNKKFILGPHFSTLPNYRINNIDNSMNNCVYIQPSEWAVNVWKDLNFNKMPLKICPFGQEIS